MQTTSPGASATCWMKSEFLGLSASAFLFWAPPPKRFLEEPVNRREKEYDRGRRKKVRGPPRGPVGGPNPFEELALARAQKKAAAGRGGGGRR